MSRNVLAEQKTVVQCDYGPLLRRGWYVHGLVPMNFYLIFSNT